MFYAGPPCDARATASSSRGLQWKVIMYCGMAFYDCVTCLTLGGKWADLAHSNFTGPDCTQYSMYSIVPMQMEAIAAKAAEAKAADATKARKGSGVVARPAEVVAAVTQQCKQLAHDVRLGFLTAPGTTQHNVQSDGKQNKAPQDKVLHSVLSLYAVCLRCHVHVSTALCTYVACASGCTAIIFHTWIVDVCCEAM